MKKTALILLALVIAASGCVSNTETENSGGGPIIDHEKQVTHGQQYTTVDIVVETQFSCSWASPPEKPVKYETKLISQGEVVKTKTWERKFTDCMNKQSDYLSFTVSSKYKNFLVITKAQNYDT